jgi:hypothetical protein
MKRIIKLTESDLTRIVRRVLNEQNPKGSTISAQAQIKIDKAVTDSQSTLNTVLYKPVFWVSSNMSVHEYADGASYKDSITKVEFFNRQDGLLGITFRYNLIKSPIYDLCLGDPGMIGIGKSNQVKQIPISFDNVVKHVFNGTMAQGEGRTYTDEKGRLITVVVNPVTSKDTITAVVNMLLTLSEKYAKGIWTKS